MKTLKPSNRARGRPRGFDRDQVLDRAMHLFWERGYEATSISELTEAMGITPPTLYTFFGDKKQLFSAVVDRYQAGPGCFAARAFCEEPTAERAIRRLLTEAVISFSNPRGPRGCLVVLGATNCSVESTAVFEDLADRRRAAERAVRDRIHAGKAAGELKESADADALAGKVTATLLGLAIMARDGTPRKKLLRVVEEFMRSWPKRISVGVR